MKTELSIIIPVRNESANIKVMLKILIAILEVPYEILIVYDTADDRTIPTIKKIQKKYPQVKLVRNALGRGVRNALKAGVGSSSGKYLLIFAADEAGPVLAIEDMITLMDKGCELVSATRYAHGGRRLGGSLIQGFLSRLGNYIFNLIGGIALSDSTTGIKMFRKELFERLDLKSNVGWAVVFEFAIKAQYLNAKLGEVPIISIDRLYGGSSTFRVGPWLIEYLKLFLFGVVKLRKTGKKRKVLIRIPENIVRTS